MVMPFRSDLIPSDQWIAVTDERLYRHDVAWSLDSNLLYWFANEDGRDCLYAQRLNVSTKRPVGAHFAVRHFHQRVRTPSFYDFYMQFHDNKLLIPLTETTSNIWIRNLSAAE